MTERDNERIIYIYIYIYLIMRIIMIIIINISGVVDGGAWG
jgi:hypothetical protein